jgi:hypothetical protein
MASIGRSELTTEVLRHFLPLIFNDLERAAIAAIFMLCSISIVWNVMMTFSRNAFHFYMAKAAIVLFSASSVYLGGCY